MNRITLCFLLNSKTATFMVVLFINAIFLSNTYARNEQNIDTKALIEKVITTYGGNKLTAASSITITDHNKGPWPGESENPGLPEIWRINEELTIDFKNKRKSLISYRVPRTTLDLEKWVYDGEKGVIFDILHQKYSEQDWINFNNLGGSVVRSSDTLQARRLFSDLKQADIIGQSYYRGLPHSLLKVTLNSGREFTYVIDNKSGVIKKILREHPAVGKMVYVFSNHTKKNGVLYARDMNFFVNGELRLASVYRDINLNPDLTQAFSGFNNYQPWGESFDTSKHWVKEISDKVYQSGKDRNVTLFFEQSDHFIAMGGARNIESNYTKLLESTNINKPIKFYIVTHHHRTNLSGLNNLVNMGAQLVVAEAHKNTVLDSLKELDGPINVKTIINRQPYKLGNLELIDIATAHSEHYLLAYSPDLKTVFAEEHYETNLKTNKPRIYKDMVLFRSVLAKLDLDLAFLVDVRSQRKITVDEFYNWTENFEDKRCPDGYPVCENG